MLKGKLNYQIKKKKKLITSRLTICHICNILGTAKGVHEKHGQNHRQCQSKEQSGLNILLIFYFIFFIKSLRMEVVALETSERAHSIEKMKVLLPFLKSQK